MRDEKARHRLQLVLMWKNLGRNLICKTYLVGKVERVMKELRFGGVLFDSLVRRFLILSMCVENLALLEKINWEKSVK